MSNSFSVFFIVAFIVFSVISFFAYLMIAVPVGDLTAAVATPYSSLCFNRSVDEFTIYPYHGTSMYPLFVPGDRVFVLETNDTTRLFPGTLVVADHPLHGLVLHKVSSVDSNGYFRLRGIANSADDVYLYRPVDFVGYACGVLYGYR